MAYKVKRKFLIGADPELFLRTLGGDFVSAHDIIEGTKHMPLKVRSGAIQCDGTAAEFNVDASDDRETFVGEVRDVVFQMLEHVRRSSHPQAGSLELVATPVAQYLPEYFKSLPEDARRLGCDPDYDAYSMSYNEPPDQDVTFRTGGGHVHVGFTDLAVIDDPAHFYDCASLTKQLDAVLFMTSKMWDRDDKRRELYGRRGAFRPKPYGVEYRSLSNAWVSDEDLVRWVFDATQEATHMLFEEHLPLFEEPGVPELLASDKHTDAHIIDHYFNLREYGIPKLPDKFVEPFLEHAKAY